jgi:primosomal protein N' (replication factor Y)
MDQSTLFSGMEEEPILQDSPPHAGPVAIVAIERSLDKVLTYAIPNGFDKTLQVGQRVKVPLGRGNKPALGYVVEINPHPATLRPLKPILSIDDARILLPPTLMELTRWMSRYYCCPLGHVIESVIPAAVKKKVGLGYTAMARLAWPREKMQETLEKIGAPKRRALLARILQIQDGQAEEVIRIARESGVKPASVRRLAKKGIITVTLEPDWDFLGGGVAQSDIRIQGDGLPLNEDQSKVIAELLPRLKTGFSVNLIHGVTGSGKTEVYLRCLQDVIAAGQRAIVMVPEIALTPQTVRRFTARFPRVAVLHSGLAAGARHRFWQQVAQGDADVVVGARSAIFAPIPNLGIIVVDEEHEGSYKQDQAPRYHGRDIAIKRAQIERCPVLLGSATPSMESWHRATTRSYHLLSMPHRVRNLKMPQIELVDMKMEAKFHKTGVHLISRRLEALLKTTLDAGQQAILLLNRRGYSNFVYCSSCTHLVQCKYCDATMTYHRSAGAKAKGGSFEEGLHTGQLHCHYCLAVNVLPDKCPDCGKKLSLFGLGTQRVEEELVRKFPNLRFARVDGDTMHSAKDYESTLDRFAKGEIQVMLGTQMIAKGLDYPNVTLVGVISGDTALALPDFRAAERTFHLITQVAGRAGRGDAPGRVILQTFNPEDRTIQAAIKQDFEGFARLEINQRAEVGLPPTTRMVRIILRDQDLDHLHQRCDTLSAALSAAVAMEGNQVTIKGPMPCAINRISGYHRFQVLLFAAAPNLLQQVLAVVRKEGGFTATDRLAVDVDPVSLL